MSNSEYVLTFQGTKLDEPSMMEYSLKKAPVTFNFNGNDVVTTEGYASYVAVLFKCISDKAKKIPGGTGNLGHVTGHSLGGAAATIFASTGAAPNAALTTFGAPPTLMSTYDQMKTNLKGKYDIMENQFKKVNKGMDNSWQPAVVTTSVTGTRYFHKFDPVPGYYFNGLVWDHGVSSSTLLYDVEGDCNSKGSFNPGYDYLDTRGSPARPIAGIGKLHTHLCTKSGVQVHGWQVPRGNDNYYSYTNAINPFPCAEAAGSHVMNYLDQATNVNVLKTALKWTPYEGVEQCVASYLATIDAYLTTYFSSALTGQKNKQNALFYITFYTMWGLWWIHASYPNYPLDGETFAGALTYAKPSFK